MTPDLSFKPHAPMRTRALPPAASRRPVAALWLALVSVGCGLAGCASPPAPVEQLAVAEAAVQRAATAGNQEWAAAELRVATDKLAAARSALAAGDRDLARRLAEQAEVDAQVADVQAQARRSLKAAQETRDAARVLREEINRKSTR